MDTGLHDTNLLAAHLDGRLDEQESAQLIAHLGECAECRAMLAGFARASARTTDRSVGGSAASRRFFRPIVWLPVAATVAIGTVTGVVTLRLKRSDPASPPSTSAPVPIPATTGDPKPPANPIQATPAPPTAARGPAAGEPVLPKRAGERTVGGKRFRFEAGEWIDASYDRLALLPVVDARTPDERAALLGRVPGLRPYAALGSRVVVVHDGTVYRIGSLNAARPSARNLPRAPDAGTPVW